MIETLPFALCGALCTPYKIYTMLNESYKLVYWWEKTPQSLLVRNEDNVCVWNCTPLIGGSAGKCLRKLRLLQSHYGGFYFFKLALLFCILHLFILSSAQETEPMTITYTESNANYPQPRTWLSL